MFIPEITAHALLDLNLPDLPIESVVLDMMINARLAKPVQLVNGLKPGTITQAIRGEPVRTVITAT